MQKRTVVLLVALSIALLLPVQARERRGLGFGLDAGRRPTGKVYGLSVPEVTPGNTDEVIWEPEVRLSFNTAHDQTDSSNQYNVAVDRSGRVHVVWTNLTNYRTIYKRFTPGSGWGDSVMLGTDIPGTHYDRYPSLCLDDSGRLHVVWVTGPNTSANAAVYYQMWHPATGWNPASRMISDDSVAKPKTSPHIACTPDGRVHVVWCERTSTTKYAYYVAYREKVDTTWQPQFNLDFADYERISACIAGGPDNRVHVAWRGSDQANPTYSQIFYKEKTAAGWQPLVRITNGLTTHQTQPSICVNPVTRQPHIVWRSLVTTNGRICHTYRVGGVWQPTDTVSERTLNTAQADPQVVAAPDGRVYVVWSGFSVASPSYQQIRSCERTPEGVWRAPRDITTGAYAKFAPSLALDTLDGLYLYLVWRDMRNGSTNSDIYYRFGFDPAKDVAVLSVVSPTPIYMRGTAAVVPQAWVKNFGTANLDSFPVVMKLGDGYTDRFVVRNLISGESTLVSFAPWQPTGGVYPMKCSTLLNGDRVNANDFRTGLILVADFIEQFEADNGRYEPTPPTGAWAWGVPSSPRPPALSGTRVWGAPLSGNYVDNADWRLVSVPYVAYVDTPVVSFWHWYNFELGYDGGNLSYSTDNGATWNVVHPWTKYSAPYYSGTVRGLGYEYGYSGSTTGWERAYFRIPVDSGTVVRLRWRLGSDISNTSPGWIIEDVTLLGLAKPDVGVVSLVVPTGTLVRDTLIPRAWVRNFGSALTLPNSFTVSLVVPPDTYVSTVPVGPLAMSESVLVSFAKWIPPRVGFYMAKCSTRLQGDILPANNSITAEAAIVNFIESFTASNGSYVPTPTTGAWAWGVPAAPRKPARSLPNAWGATLTGSYGNSVNWRLVSVPYAALADTPAISFWHWRNFYDANDGGNVAYSTDNGATWTVLMPWPGRSAPYYSAPIPGLGNERGYTLVDTNWTQAWFQIPVTAGTAFWLRWRLGSDASYTSHGWMIDDVAGMNVALAKDAAVTAITAPASMFVLDTVVPAAWVKNLGSAPLDSFQVRMTIGTEYSSTVSAGPLAVGDSVLVSFAKWLPSRAGFFEAKCSTRLAGDNYPVNDFRSVSCVVVNFTETFEATNGSYKPDPTSAAWTWGAPASPRPAARSGTKVWGAPLSGNYANSANWKLVSIPYVAMQDTPVVTFWHWYQFQAPPTPPTAAYDGGNVSYSTDNGNTWIVISPWAARSAPYHSAVITGLQNEYGYTGSISAWTQAWFQIPVANGTRFLLRWRLGSDASTTNYGWMIEDVSGIGMRPLADVQASSIVAPTGTIDFGTVVTPKAKVRNLGGANATFNAVFRIADRYEDTKLVTDLLPGEEREITFRDWTADTAATVTLSCSTALRGDDVPGNDKVTGAAFIRLQDVQSVAIMAPVGAVDSGSVIVPRVRVRNNGNQPATFPTLLTIGGYSNTQTVTNLAPGEEREVTFAAWSATVRGQYTVKCSTRLSGDRNPGNDRVTATVWVVRYDVGVDTILVPADSVDSGTVVVPSVRVRNYTQDSARFVVWFKIHRADEDALTCGAAETAVQASDGSDQTYVDSLVLSLRGGENVIAVFEKEWIAGPVGNYRLESYTVLAGDINRANDTVRGTLRVARVVRDVGTVAILSPVGSIDSGTVIVPQAIVRNFGTRPETFPVMLTIGSAYVDTQFVRLDIGQEDTVEFTEWTAQPRGRLRVVARTLLAGDANPSNDARTDSVEVRTPGGVGEAGELPQRFAITGVVPNPLSRTGVLRLALPAAMPVNVTLYDAAGRVVQVLLDGQLPAGYHEVRLAGTELREGVYILDLAVAGNRWKEKLVVTRE